MFQGAIAPSRERFGRVGHDQVHVEVDHVAEAFAVRASAERAVEAEQPRFESRDIRGRTLRIACGR